MPVGQEDEAGPSRRDSGGAFSIHRFAVSKKRPKAPRRQVMLGDSDDSDAEEITSARVRGSHELSSRFDLIPMPTIVLSPPHAESSKHGLDHDSSTPSEKARDLPKPSVIDHSSEDRDKRATLAQTSSGTDGEEQPEQIDEDALMRAYVDGCATVQNVDDMTSQNGSNSHQNRAQENIEMQDLAHFTAPAVVESRETSGQGSPGKSPEKIGAKKWHLFRRMSFGKPMGRFCKCLCLHCCQPLPRTTPLARLRAEHAQAQAQAQAEAEAVPAVEVPVEFPMEVGRGSAAVTEEAGGRDDAEPQSSSRVSNEQLGEGR